MFTDSQDPAVIVPVPGIDPNALTPLQDALRAVNHTRKQSIRAERRISQQVFDSELALEIDALADEDDEDDDDADDVLEGPAIDPGVDFRFVSGGGMGLSPANLTIAASALIMDEGDAVENVTTPTPLVTATGPSRGSSTNLTTGFSAAMRSNFYYHFRRDRVDRLLPEEIRWFYRPPMEKVWTPFIGYDSLRIETKFQELQHTECIHCLKRMSAMQPHFRPDLLTSMEEEESPVELGDSCKETIIVRGGMFEVDVLAKKMMPIYWSGVVQTSRIMRGTWFKGEPWQPLVEELAERIEAEHMDKFGGQRMADLLAASFELNGDKKKTAVLHTVQIAEFHVDWYQVEEVYLYSESPTLFIKQKLGMQKVGARLRRGYHTFADMSDRPPDITHLCFVIHGIGQKILTGAIIKCCDDLRASCEKVKTRHFSQLDGMNERVEFLPVEWRSALRLDGDAVSSITPHHLRGLRTLLNSSALDILYYTSPLHRAEIIQGLSTELDRLYSMFCARNPYFEARGGKVSIVAHSLGSVITYDILLGGENSHHLEKVFHMYRDKVSETHMGEFLVHLKDLEEARAKVTNIENKIMRLTTASDEQHSPPAFPKTVNFPNNFKTGDLWKKLPRLENFFCLGSPLAVFIALRGFRSSNSGDLETFLPRNVCRRIYNLYHPADPVAYRIEPLLLRSYGDIHPVVVHRWDSAQVQDAYHLLPLEIIQNQWKRRTFQVPYSGNHSKQSNRLRPNGDNSSMPAESTESGVGKSTTSSADGPEIANHVDVTDVGIKEPGTGSSFGSRIQSLISLMRGPSSPLGSSKTFFTPEDSTNSGSVTPEPPNGPQPPMDVLEFDLMHFDDVEPTENILTTTGLDIEPPADPAHSRASSSNSLPTSSIATSEAGETLKDSVLDNMSSLSLSRSPSYSSSVTTATTNKTAQLEHRIDFELRSSRYENSYLAILTSHTAYWTNPDVAMFLMSQLFAHHNKSSANH